jgi:DnaJ-class molecular chaperone
MVRHTVDKSASEKDIRAAYKRLSKKYHPDKNKDPDAEGKFVEIARGECERVRQFSACK